MQGARGDCWWKLGEGQKSRHIQWYLDARLADAQKRRETSSREQKYTENEVEGMIRTDTIVPMNIKPRNRLRLTKTYAQDPRNILRQAKTRTARSSDGRQQVQAKNKVLQVLQRMSRGTSEETSTVRPRNGRQQGKKQKGVHSRIAWESG